MKPTLFLKTKQMNNSTVFAGICIPLPIVVSVPGSAYDFFKGVTEQYPDLTMAATLLPLYKKMQDYKDAIWTIQGGFYTPIDKLRTHEFRVQIADILRKMGGVCDEIVMAYGEVSETN